MIYTAFLKLKLHSSKYEIFLQHPQQPTAAAAAAAGSNQYLVLLLALGRRRGLGRRGLRLQLLYLPIRNKFLLHMLCIY